MVIEVMDYEESIRGEDREASAAARNDWTFYDE
jgi:hypothetical protein